MTVEPDKMLSIVTPAFNEQENISILYNKLKDMMKKSGVNWEWVVVDDHSGDESFSVVRGLAKNDERVRGIRLARNFGSHTALTCGLHHARGDCSVVLAADLQDPPEIIEKLMEKWKQGAQVVWAVREGQHGGDAGTGIFSRFYYWIMRHLLSMKEMPARGADFFLVDRRVIEALKQFSEANVSVLALITWMGFRQERIFYVKKPRLHGKSGWNLEKKLKLVVDSITSFTYLPIRLMIYVGFGIAVLGFLYALVVIVNAFIGNPPQGWSSLMVVVLMIGGIQMMMMGVLGEYLWRALDESRRRPRYLIEEDTLDKKSRG